MPIKLIGLFERIKRVCANRRNGTVVLRQSIRTPVTEVERNEKIQKKNRPLALFSRTNLACVCLCWLCVLFLRLQDNSFGTGVCWFFHSFLLNHEFANNLLLASADRFDQHHHQQQQYTAVAYLFLFLYHFKVCR